MNLTLFGYPKAGKTTLFNLLTGARLEVKGYEDGKKEPHQRTTAIPDSRLDLVATLYPERKKNPASAELMDLAGMSFGEVKNSIYLSHLRRADLLVHVVRGFDDPQLPHPRGKISPQDDIISMEEELMLTDLIAVETRLERLEKDLKKAKDQEGEKEKEILTSFHSFLESRQALREISLTAAEEKLIRSFAFLSLKPVLHAVNVGENDIPMTEDVEKLGLLSKPGTGILAFCGKIEREIMELEGEEKDAFLTEYGLKEPTAPKFFKVFPQLLGMIFFFTIGKDEVKAWPLPRHSPALKAAGVIHSDIEKGFIRAEVISWDELLRQGSFQQARDKGAVRLEGKEYIVRDGDVIYFRFA